MIVRQVNRGIVSFFLLLGALSISQRMFSQTLDLYRDENTYWFPSGWMPDGNGVSANSNSHQNPSSGSSCVELNFELKKLSQGWAGVYWLTNDSWNGPGINIYQKLGVPNGTRVKLTFRIRGAEGGERFQFKVGGISDGNDSIKFPVTSNWITLDSLWSENPIEIDLTGQDLSNVVGGFCVVTNKPRNPQRDMLTIFLDDIKYEVIRN